MKISPTEFDTVLSELRAHRELPQGHSDCEFCDWVKEFVKTAHGQILAEDSDQSGQYLDRLFFLYAGVRIGRNQGVDDLLSGLVKD